MDVLLTFETLPEYVPNVKMKEKSWEEARLPGITLPGYDRPCNKKKYMDEERIKKEQQSSDAKNGNSKRKMGGLKPITDHMEYIEALNIMKLTMGLVDESVSDQMRRQLISYCMERMNYM